ncbi:MAG: hypothetical protein LBV43_09685 [Prevotella sp.]|jgi:lysozyme|nr:hypothetical protein [Prevotella sp.]
MPKKPYKKRKRKRSGKKDTNIRRKYIVSFLLVFSLILLATILIWNYYHEPESFTSEKYYVKGIDLSHHNPIPDWNVLVDQNVYFAYIKATEGISHEDRNYIYNYELAHETNIKIGSYHFFNFAVPGKEQAKYFIQKAKFSTGDLLPAIDVEHSPANLYNKDKKCIDDVVKELKVLESELYEHFGVHPVIYTNGDCYKLYIKGNFPENIIWMCDLHKEPSKDVNWRIWQFSHNGEMPGIDGDVDLNYYRYSFQEFQELLLP